MKRTPVVVREARPDDCAAIREFVSELSPQAQYLRFFASVAPPSTGLLRVLCGSTGADILLITDPAGRIIGHGMAADTAPARGTANTRSAANIGLVVAGQWQQQGLGTLMLTMLISRAARRGVTSLVLDVLPENRRMLGIIDRRWPDAPRERTRDAIVIRPAITPGQAAARGTVPALVRLPYRGRQEGDLRAPSRSAA